MVDEVSTLRLKDVHPKLAALVEQLDAAMFAKGVTIRVVQGLRTMEYQAQLYAQGRTAPGRIVTDAEPGYSYHNFGTAVDIVPGERGSTLWQPNWDHESDDFRAMIATGIELGLVSGSTWVTLKDYPHFQLAGLPVTPTQDMRDCINQGGIQAFWTEYVK